ncbi:MAG: tyrosine-type recombinase/integrase [Cyanobacteriota/Melainabacteria group bacterium]
MNKEALLQRDVLVKRFGGELSRYKTRLARLDLSPNTREAYRSRLNNFLGYLATSSQDYSDFFDDSACRALAVREYKSHLKREHASPATVNSSLTAIDHFLKFLGLEKPKAKREQLPDLAPQALSKHEQMRLLVIADHARPIDRAIIYLLLYSGIRLSECADLNVEDLLISERKGKVIVRDGKGGQYREVPLNSDARAAIEPWLAERARRESKKKVSEAVFLNPQGKRLSRRSIDKAVRKLGLKSGIELSAHTLRHTCLTNLMRAGSDVGIVAQIAGHKKLETTKRYTLPRKEDLESAMEGISLER